MPTIAIVNRKGGSGKSTVATHLAVHLAQAGHAVMLGDLDVSHNAQTWQARRMALRRAPHGKVLPGPAHVESLTRMPSGATHLVLDTPGGLSGLDLARVTMAADLILMPVGHSVFDREAAAACLAELRAQPRIANGRCKLAALGMRVGLRSPAGEALRSWAQAFDLPLLGVLRDNQAYVQCVERGLSLFDLHPGQIAIDLDQWRPVLSWLDDKLAALAVPAAPVMLGASAAPATPATCSRPVVSQAIRVPSVPRTAAPLGLSAEMRAPHLSRREAAPVRLGLLAQLAGRFKLRRTLHLG